MHGSGRRCGEREREMYQVQARMGLRILVPRVGTFQFFGEDSFIVKGILQ